MKEDVPALLLEARGGVAQLGGILEGDVGDDGAQWCPFGGAGDVDIVVDVVDYRSKSDQMVHVFTERSCAQVLSRSWESSCLDVLTEYAADKGALVVVELESNAYGDSPDWGVCST